ncbi:MAG: FixH family protein [Adhaeribacter sp.]
MNTSAVKNKSSWWPKLIVAAFVGFALFIGNMVRQAMRTDVDLVSKDYYQKEIAYQDHIDQVAATRRLEAQVRIVHAAAAGQLSLDFPAASRPAAGQGQVRFFRPSDAQLDFELPLQLNAEGQQHIPTGRLARGMWRVQVTWSLQGQDYFLEKNISL